MVCVPVAPEWSYCSPFAVINLHQSASDDSLHALFAVKAKDVVFPASHVNSCIFGNVEASTFDSLSHATKMVAAARSSIIVFTLIFALVL